MLLKKAVEIDAFDRKEDGLFNRSNRSRPSNTIDDGHLAEKIPGEQNRQHGLLGPPHVFDDFHGSLTDDEHSIPWFTFPDDDVVLLKHRFFDSARDFVDRAGREPGKNGDGLQKRLPQTARVQADGRSVSHDRIFTGPAGGSNEKTEFRSSGVQELQNSRAFRFDYEIPKGIA